MKHSPNILLSLLSLSEEHPQHVCVVNFINCFSTRILRTLLVKPSITLSVASLLRCLGIFSFLFLNTLPSVASSTCIGSGVVSEGLGVGSGGFAKGLGGGRSALIRSLSIDGNHTWWVRGACRSMGGEVGRSMTVSLYRSMVGSYCRSFLT
ncbi:hypothetical protein YC2023_089172 [Brassica napus]